MKRLMVLLLVLAVMLVPAASAFAAQQAQMERVLIGFRGPADAALVRAHGGQVTRQYINIPAVAARLPLAAIDGLAHNPKIDYIEPDSIAHAVGQILPWGVDRIDAEVAQAAPYGYTGTGVKVAIIDTGIDTEHPDLDVMGGAYFVDGVSSFDDDAGHGTHVAGTVAALNNDYGVVGVAPEASLYAVKVLDSSGSGYYSWIVDGIDWAITNHMDVINMSLGGSSGSTALEDICNEAYNSGIVVVAAGGNEGNRAGKGDNIGYPARYESVIAVGATDKNDLRAKFSSTGPALEIMAPGVDIESTHPMDMYEYAYGSGTSMASPHVAGAAALVLQANPGMSAAEVRARLIETAEPIGNGDPNLYANGLVDAQAAVEGGATPPPTNQAPTASIDSYNCTGLSCTFYGSGDDTDGSVVSYSWAFGDGATATGTTASHEYTAGGDYNVILTVTDNDGATGTDTQTVTVSDVEPPVTGSMHVAGLTNASVFAGKNWKAGVTATIEDGLGSPVANATVVFDLSGDLTGTLSCVTDGAGMCTAMASPSKKAADVTFAVTDVQHVSYTWDGTPAALEVLKSQTTSRTK